MEFSFSPLNLYTNFKEACQSHPSTSMVFDELLPAFPEIGYETTYEEVHQAILKRAYQLNHMRLKKHDFLIIFKSSRFDTYLLAVAASYLGIIPVMISYHFKEDTLAVFQERLDDPYIIYDDVTSSVIDKLQSHKAFSVRDLVLEDEEPISQQFLKEDEISYITHTSGTTGIPKLICHSAISMGWRVYWHCLIFSKIDRIDRIGFLISPVHSRYNIGISSLMKIGYPLMPLSNSKLSVIKSMLTKYPVIALETHPNHFLQWRVLTQTCPEIFKTVKYYHSTFDAINNQTMVDFLSTSGHKEAYFLQVYGQSECGPMILKVHTLDSLKTDEGRDMGQGLAPLTDARIVDENKNLLSKNTPGHIQLLSRGRALTYYKENERFNENVDGDWWDSGDYGYINDEGHLFLQDRQVDLIKNIESNLQLEDFLLDHLSFLAEVVIVRDPEGKPQPIIAINEGQTFDEDAWWQAVSDLPYLNKPIIWDYDQFPRTATMKIRRLTIESQLK